MKITDHLTRTAAAAAATALVTAGLGIAAAPAQAAPVFSELTLEHQGDLFTQGFGPGCAWSPETGGVPADIAVSEGETRTSSFQLGSVGFVTGAPADNYTASAKASGTVKATTEGGAPKSIRLDFSGTASAITSQATSTGCRARPFAALRFNYRFTIAKPMWATLSYTKTGGSYVEAYVSGSSNPGDAGSYEELYGWSSKGQGSSTVYLPAGAYQGYVQGEPGLTAYATSTVVHDSKGSVKIDLAPAGSAITLPSGSAQSYARLGKARSCTTHTLPAALTSDSTRIKKISRVSFAVNGTTVKSLKGTSIKRGLAIKIPIADSVKASVKTTVTLKNGDKRTATASYRACA